MKEFKNRIKLVMLSFLIAFGLSAEENQLPKLAVLPTTDLTSWGLAEALQYSLGKLAVGTRLFDVGSSDFVLMGFSRKDLRMAFEANRASFLVFAYIEHSRISIFLFNANFPGKFIASNKSLDNPPNGKISSHFVETQFRNAFDETMALFSRNEYASLPKVEGDEPDTSDKAVAVTVKKNKSEQMKELFHEISQLEDRPFYIGANIGMARYTNNTSNSASTANLGVLVGGRFNHDVSASLGLEFFSYAFMHGDVFYRLPVMEKYITLSLSASVGSVLASLTDNKGYGANSDYLKNGSIYFGPGLAIDIPLLGASLRGEVKYYLGSSSIFIGTYGLVLSL